MKQWLVGSVVGLMLGGGLQASEENLVKNGGFEATNPAEGWQIPSGWRLEEGVGPDKSRAIVWENDDPAKYTFPLYRVNFEPGGVYRFGAKVRKEMLNTGAIYVNLEWCDRNGKYIGYCEGRQVHDNDVSLSDGWVRYGGTTAPMPGDVGGGSIVCFLTKGSTGRVQVDDFFIEPKGVEPVELFTSSAYRDTATAGDVRFFASLNINTQKVPLSDCAAEMAYRDADGEKKVRAADRLTASEAHFRIAAESFAFGRQTVGFRLRNVRTGATIGGRTLAFTREREPQNRRVTFDAARRLTVDGKRYFPLGLYAYSLKNEDFELFRKGGFNSIVRYGNISASEMDAFWRNGLMVSPDIRGFMSVLDEKRSEQELLTKLTAKVKEIGSHPALLTWYVNDEAPITYVKRLCQVNAWLRELDPNHPTFAVLDKPQHVRSYMPSYDILAIDTYPIGNRGGKDVSRVATRLCAGKEAMLDFRETWKVPQAFNWAWYRKGEDLKKPHLRMPTRAEMANMAWQSIAAGANGVYFYSFADLRKHLSGDDFVREWANVSAVGCEIKSMERVLLADGGTSAVGQVPEKLVARTYRTADKSWLLLVNRTDEPVSAELKLAEAWRDVKTVLGAGVNHQGSLLRVSFDGLGYAWLELAK